MRALARRAVTVPSVLLLFVLALGSAPLWVPLAALADVVRRGRTSFLACGAFLLWYLACEVLGLLAIVAVTALRLAGPSAYRRANHALQNAWGGALFAGARASFWRIPRDELPADERGRADWLHEQWRRVDAWVAAHQSP